MIMIGLFLASLAALAAAAPNKRIIGGIDASPGEFASIGKLKSNDVFICGCVLVGEKWILTAAHCVGRAASEYSVELGRHDRTDDNEIGAVSRKIRRVIIHEGYNPDKNGYPNDVALMEMTSSVDTSGANINIAKLDDGTNVEVNDNVWIVGWGRTGSGSSAQLATVLQKAAIQKISLSTCQSKWGDSVNNNHVCVHDHLGTDSACNGDSGGPMYSVDDKDMLVGITSWGQSGCYGTYPSVYSRVAAFAAWIESRIN